MASRCGSPSSSPRAVVVPLAFSPLRGLTVLELITAVPAAHFARSGHPPSVRRGRPGLPLRGWARRATTPFGSSGPHARLRRRAGPCLFRRAGAGDSARRLRRPLVSPRSPGVLEEEQLSGTSRRRMTCVSTSSRRERRSSARGPWSSKEPNDSRASFGSSLWSRRSSSRSASRAAWACPSVKRHSVPFSSRRSPSSRSKRRLP